MSVDCSILTFLLFFNSYNHKQEDRGDEQPLDLTIGGNLQGNYGERREGGDVSELDEFGVVYREVERLRWRERVGIETSEQRDIRLSRVRENRLARRADESSSDRDQRVVAHRQRVQQLRHSRNSDLFMSAFSYSPQMVYSEHPSVCIGKMDVICEYCNARRFKGEPGGMCCSNGKVR